MGLRGRGGATAIFLPSALEPVGLSLCRYIAPVTSKEGAGSRSENRGQEGGLS